MKKKIVSLCLVVALAATAVIGGTLAYFTDTDTETNVFTAGNIKIAIEEDFPEDELMPGAWNKNNLKKEVYVRNTGDNAAYMWIEVLIPAVLDTPDDASQNDLHFNPFDTYMDAEGKLIPCKSSVANTNGYKPVATTAEVKMGSVEIDGITYNRYLEYIVDDTAKDPGARTYALLAQVYMDKDIKQCDETCKNDAAKCLVLKDGTHYAGSWELVINAYGIQAQGMGSIKEAINTYYDKTVIE